MKLRFAQEYLIKFVLLIACPLWGYAQVPASQRTENQPARLTDAGAESQEQAKDQLYSGPQVSEELANFDLKLVLGDSAGKTIDPVALAQGKPIVLVFVHDVNRQSISMTRVLTQYAQSRAKDGLHCAVILLAEDATGAEETLKRIQHALTPKVATGVSPDGREGPGTYGLNRAVQLTILVANKNRVTGNFALVQPSLQVDLPKIADSIVQQVGGSAPKLSEMLEAGGAMQRGQGDSRATDSAKPDPETIRALVRPLIQLNAQTEQVDKAAEAIEDAISKSSVVQQEIGRIASTIVSSGKLENYGTPHAQAYLKRWAGKYGQGSVKPKDDVRKP